MSRPYDPFGVEMTGGRFCSLCNTMHPASARCYGDPLGFSAERAAQGEADADAGRTRPVDEVFRGLRDTPALRAEIDRLRARVAELEADAARWRWVAAHATVCPNEDSQFVLGAVLREMDDDEVDACGFAEGHAVVTTWVDEARALPGAGR